MCVIASPMMASAAADEPQPLVRIISPQANEVIGDSTVTLEWETLLPDVSCVIYLDKVPLSGTDAKSSVELTGLGDGSHSVEIWAFTGTDSQWLTVTFFVDTSDPKLEIVSPSNGYALNTTDVPILWNAYDASPISRFIVEVTKGGDHLKTVRLNGTESSYTLEDLENAGYTVKITAYDWFGNSTERTVVFSVDTTIPTLEILPLQIGNGPDSGTVTVEWTASDEGGNIVGFDVYLNGAYQTTVAASKREIRFNELKEGQYTLDIVAIDSANNTARKSISFNTVPLSIEDAFPVNGAVIGTEIWIRYSKPIDPEASTIGVLGVDGTVRCEGDTLIFVPDAPLAVGTTYMVRVVAVDHSGKWANHTWSFNTISGGYVIGYVQDADESPLANARVYMPGGPSTVTADDGSFRLEAPSGNQTITVSLSGYVTRTMPVNVVPGAERSVGAVQLASSELITMIGWAVAILAIALVMIIYYVRRERGRKRRWSPPKRQMKGKPRSWRKMEKAERRPRRTEHTLDDFEPDDRRYEYEDDVFGPNERL